tara:strand:- start:101 stop:616 length:516 start_codon:yes stop_codon:yes gene_type:complete
MDNFDLKKYLSEGKLLNELLNESEKIDVYRGENSGYYGSKVNNGFLWVSNDIEYAKEFSNNVVTYQINKPLKVFTYPYSMNQSITDEQFMKKLDQATIKFGKDGGLNRDLFIKLKKLSEKIQNNLNGRQSSFQNKLNNPKVSNLISQYLKLLRYEAVKVVEDGVINYGLLK